MNEHAGFILLAYGITTLVIGGIALRIILDYRRLRAELARFGAEGRREEGLREENRRDLGDPA